jgi:hypothetical protein
MKLLTAFLLIAAVMWAAGGQAAKKAESGQPAKQPAKPAAAQPAKPPAKPAAPVRQIQTVEIPKGAVEYEPGSFRFTDAQGKKWIFRKTPFGVARMEDRPAAAAPDPSADLTKATEVGDSIRFERPGPFGTYRWERKKSELTETEKAAWERQRLQAAKQD